MPTAGIVFRAKPTYLFYTLLVCVGHHNFKLGTLRTVEAFGEWQPFETFLTAIDSWNGSLAAGIKDNCIPITSRRCMDNLSPGAPRCSIDRRCSSMKKQAYAL